ncbi:MAG: sigma-70 family RNA polymerase sigma factor [Planctomycetota bacterium]
MTDSQALQRYAHDRDADAFRQLVLTHQRLVYATARRCLGNDADAEDATQETFLRLAKNAGRVRGEVGGWLHRCATYVAIDRVRSDSARRRREGATAKRDVGDDHTSTAEATELTREVDRAIAGLRASDRSALVSYYLEGRPQTELAREAGITQAGMRKRLDRALERVRRSLRARGVVAAGGAVAALLRDAGAQAQVSSALTENLIRIGVSGVGPTSLTQGGLLMASSWTTGKIVTAAATSAVLLTGGVTAVVVSRDAPAVEGAPAATPPPPAAASTPAPVAQPADDPYDAADHGLELKPAVIRPKLVLVSRQTIYAEEIPFVIPTAFQTLSGVMEDAALEPAGMSITAFREADPPVGPDGQPMFDFTFAVPVVGEAEVPQPFTIESFPRFPCVTCRHTGNVSAPAFMWPKVISQAAFDGHRLTGEFRLEGIEWVGFNSNQNVFSFQVGVVEE